MQRKITDFFYIFQPQQKTFWQFFIYIGFFRRKNDLIGETRRFVSSIFQK